MNFLDFVLMNQISHYKYVTCYSEIKKDVLSTVLEKYVNNHKGKKICIACPTFRDCKSLLILLKNILVPNTYTTIADRCKITVNDNVIDILPIGSGDKFNGYRSDYLILYNFTSMPQEISDSIIRASSVMGDKYRLLLLDNYSLMRPKLYIDNIDVYNKDMLVVKI